MFGSRRALVAGMVVLAVAASSVLLIRHSVYGEPPQIAQGRRLYAIHCASCHGTKLEGEPDWQPPKPSGRMPAPPHDNSGHTWHHGDRELFLITKKGLAAIVPGYESDMPAIENVLSDGQIEAALAFIKSTWPAKARGYQEERNNAEMRRLGRGGRMDH